MKKKTTRKFSITTLHNLPKNNNCIDYLFRPFKQALLALKKQEYDNVIPLCTEELNGLASEDNALHKVEVLLLRGTFHLLLGQHENALADLSAVIDSDNASKEFKVNALIKRASMYIQLENAGQSFDDFESAVKLDPDCGDIYHNRGQVSLDTMVNTRHSKFMI